MLESRSDQAVATSSRGDRDEPNASTLVHAFEEVLQAAYELPLIVTVPCTHRRRGLRRYLHSLPRPPLFLKFFVVDHARTTLERIRRRMLAVAALGTAADDDEARRQCVTQYLESLPIHGRVLYSTSLVALTIVVTQFVLLSVPGAAESFGATGMAQEADVIHRLLSTITEATSNLSSLGGLLVAVGDAPLRTVAFVFTSLTTVLYVELRSFVPAFRLKRTMFNLYPQPQLVSSTPARWGVQRATGLYEVEGTVLAELGAPPRREVPFDLIVPALLLPALLFLAAMMIEAGRASWWQEGEPHLSYTIASAIIAGVLARLGWLTRAYLRRTRRYAGPYLPSEVQIRGTDLIVALREPLTIFWATAVAGAFSAGVGVAAANNDPLRAFDVARFLALVFVVAPLWFRMNRDLSAYLSVRGAARPGFPVLSLLAMAIGGLVQMSGVPVLAVIAAAAAVVVSVYNTCGRVQRAEVLAGNQNATNMLPPALLIVGFVVFPVVLAHIQRAINMVWRSDGDVLGRPDETPATATS